MRNKRRNSILLTVTCALAIAASVFACAWDAGTEHSVRFNLYHSEKEFGRLPPLPKYERSKASKLFHWDSEREYAWDRTEDETKQIDKLWDATDKDQDGGHFRELRRHLREYLERTEAPRYSRWMSPKDVQKRRNSAMDKLDALGEIDHGAAGASIAEYLAARAKYDRGDQPEEVLKHLKEASRDPRLKDNAEYLEASLRQDGDDGAKGFERIASRYPRSEKREAALFMSALLAMKRSHSYQREHEGRDEKDTRTDCRDERWHSARSGFQRVMREYPKGRYYADARGWLGHLSLLAGDRAGALVEYYRLLSESDEAGRVEALFSLCLVRHRADESDMESVEKTLEREPAAALAYAYHNIYNFAFRPSSDRRFYEDGVKEDDDSQAGETRRELGRIASFATRMMNRFPSGAVGAAFVVRVAEANLELDKGADASKLARRALTIGAEGEIRAEALWIAGVSEFRGKRYSMARQALTTLIAEHPDDRYTEGGRRQLAMLEEDTGNIEGALDQYLALDYRDDVAYFVDVLMKPEQIAAFIEQRPMLSHRDELLYGLGIRYLRDRRWTDARSTFAKIKSLGHSVDDTYVNDRYNYEALQEWERESPKTRDFDSNIRGVRSQWIEQDVRTANELERLEGEVEAASGDEARAEALYQVASYQFERSLLFYNPLAWQGGRHELLYDLDQSGAFREPNESQVLFRSMQNHDMAANSLPIYLEVVRRFPKTRAARDALYTAAVCHERLADYNNYWREIYSSGGHAGPRMVTYRDVSAAYPEYRFPRGTFHWEPSTRTVNGEPGWEKPPRPKPRPSRMTRAGELVNRWMTESFKLFNRLLSDVEFLVKQIWLAIVSAVSFVAHCCWILAMCGWLWFLWKRAREARILMKEALACCKTRPAEERGDSPLALNTTVVSATLGKYLGHDFRDRWLEAGRDAGYTLQQLVGNKRGRALIAFCAATHGLFAGLLVRLVVNW